MLVVGTNRYYQHYLDPLDDGPSVVSDMTEYEMSLFLTITVQMGELHTRPTNRLLGNMGSVLHAFLQQHNKTRQIRVRSSLLTHLRQQERS
jgi:hypothetical protein